MGLRLLRTSLSPLLSSPHRIPLLFPYPSSPSLSSLVVWADPQSISPQRQPQKDYVYCIYNLYMVLMVLSHTRPHGVLPTYTSKRHPLYCAIHRMSSLNHRLGGRRTDGRTDGREVPPPLLDADVRSLSLPSVAIIPQWDGVLFSYSGAAVGWTCEKRLFFLRSNRKRLRS